MWAPAICTALAHASPYTDSLPPAQIVTNVEAVFKVSMPASVASLLRVFDVLVLNIEGLGLPVLSCIKLGLFFDQLFIIILAPWILGLLILACSIGVEVVTRRTTASLKAGLIRGLPSLMCLLFYAVPMVFSLAFRALDCEVFDDDTRFLRVDYSLNCNDAEYVRVVSLAWVAIVLYPVCVPLLYLTLLLSARKAILTEQPTDLSRSLSFLHHDYAPSMFWWELVETSKKARRSVSALTAPQSRVSVGSTHTVDRFTFVFARRCSSSVSACTSIPAPWSNSLPASSSRF